MAASLSMDNPVFRMFIGYAALVILKVFLVVFITIYTRFKNKVFANDEDTGSPKIKPVLNHPDVERVRRCHLNDLENVTFFVLLGLLYVSIGPSLSSAALHFRVFTAARYIHTVSYVWAVPQPARALSFLVGLVVCLSMGYQVVMAASF